MTFLTAARWSCVLFVASFVVATGCSKTYPSCGDDAECSAHGEVCVDGTCRECASDQNCRSGFACQANQCVPKGPECARDEQCPGGRICEGGRCSAPACAVDVPCQGGLTCEAGRCVVAPDAGAEQDASDAADASDAPDSSDSSDASDAALDADAPLVCAPDVVIAEVYDRGGTVVGSDFVTLHNRGAVASSLVGWSLQVAGGFATGAWQVVPLAGSIPAHGFFLVRFATQSDAGALPTPDATSSIDLQDNAVRIALVASTTPLSAERPGAGAAVDVVSIGDTFTTEGAVTSSVADSSVRRKANRCSDTDDNANDFEPATPGPQNSASTPTACACP